MSDVTELWYFYGCERQCDTRHTFMGNFKNSVTFGDSVLQGSPQEIIHLLFSVGFYHTNIYVVFGDAPEDNGHVFCGDVRRRVWTVTAEGTTCFCRSEFLSEQQHVTIIIIVMRW